MTQPTLVQEFIEALTKNLVISLQMIQELMRRSLANLLIG